MARPLSEDKRTAILEAATEVVAMHGVSAPTAKIVGCSPLFGPHQMGVSSTVVSVFNL
jgi:hypothetical protein